MFVQKFSNFDLKFGREVNLDELNNISLGTFAKFPLSTEISTLENLAKIGIFWVWRLITFEQLNRFAWKNKLHPRKIFSYHISKNHENRFSFLRGDVKKPREGRESGVKNDHFFIWYWEWINFASGKVDLNVKCEANLCWLAGIYWFIIELLYFIQYVCAKLKPAKTKILWVERNLKNFTLKHLNF